MVSLSQLHIAWFHVQLFGLLTYLLTDSAVSSPANRRTVLHYTELMTDSYAIFLPYSDYIATCEEWAMGEMMRQRGREKQSSSSAVASPDNQLADREQAAVT
jgi:hypothetical protein